MIKQRTGAWYWEGNRLVSVDLGYRKDYPVEVRMRIRDGSYTQEWATTRTLFDLGLIRRSGEGGIIFDPTDDGQVFVTLRSDEGSATLVFEADTLHKFLVATYTEVPHHLESLYASKELDKFLATL